MNTYMLILRDHEVRWDNFSAEELRGVLDLYAAWNRTLRENEQFVSAGKLKRELGKTVRAGADGLVVDGPFSEAKEAVVGYYCIRVEDEAAALEAARACPILTYGGSVELREMEQPRQ